MTVMDSAALGAASVVGVARPVRAALLVELAGEFQAFLGSPADPTSLRRRLGSGELQRVYARKAVQAEIKHRYRVAP